MLMKFGTLPDGTPSSVVKVISWLRHRLVKQYLRAYTRRTGMSMTDIEPWVVPVAAARLYEGIPNEEKETLVKLIREKLSR